MLITFGEVKQGTFFLLANMDLLFYLHTIHIHCNTLPAGVPGNRAILTSSETFKNRPTLNGKPGHISLTKFTFLTSYYPCCCPLISTNTNINIIKLTKIKHQQRELQQTDVGFVGTELSRLIRFLLESVGLV